ncbi:MAG TPA: hypothetical protein VJT09_07220, partial [Pyrinomonadaceae bacterium]|nr:hypothetical protein [Pyrinomonadaceae bacterium]
EWRAWLLAASAARHLNDEAKAREYASQASQGLSSLETKWGAEPYNSYLTRPDVQHMRKQLDEEFTSSR